MYINGYILDWFKYSGKNLYILSPCCLDLLLSYKLSKVLFHPFMMAILSKVKEIQLSEIYIQIYALSCRYNISS